MVSLGALEVFNEDGAAIACVLHRHLVAQH